MIAVDMSALEAIAFAEPEREAFLQAIKIADKTLSSTVSAVETRMVVLRADKLAYLAEHRSRTYGLGAATAGMLLVPGLNLVALGLGAAGATVAMHDRWSAELRPAIGMYPRCATPC